MTFRLLKWARAMDVKNDVEEAIRVHRGTVEGTMDVLRQDLRFAGSNSQLRYALDLLVRQGKIKPVEPSAGNSRGPMRTFAYRLVANDHAARFVR